MSNQDVHFTGFIFQWELFLDITVTLEQMIKAELGKTPGFLSLSSGLPLLYFASLLTELLSLEWILLIVFCEWFVLLDEDSCFSYENKFRLGKKRNNSMKQLILWCFDCKWRNQGPEGWEEEVESGPNAGLLWTFKAHAFQTLCHG